MKNNNENYLPAFTLSDDRTTCNFCLNNKIDIEVTLIPRNILEIPKGEEVIKTLYYHFDCALKLYPNYERRITDLKNELNKRKIR